MYQAVWRERRPRKQEDSWWRQAQREAQVAAAAVVARLMEAPEGKLLTQPWPWPLSIWSTWTLNSELACDHLDLFYQILAGVILNLVGSYFALTCLSCREMLHRSWKRRKSRCIYVWRDIEECEWEKDDNLKETINIHKERERRIEIEGGANFWQRSGQ